MTSCVSKCVISSKYSFILFLDIQMAFFFLSPPSGLCLYGLSPWSFPRPTHLTLHPPAHPLPCFLCFHSTYHQLPHYKFELPARMSALWRHDFRLFCFTALMSSGWSGIWHMLGAQSTFIERMKKLIVNILCTTKGMEEICYFILWWEIYKD